MSQEAVKMGIVGLGRWAKVLARAARQSSALKIVAGYSRSEEKRAAFEKELGVPSVPDLKTLLARPDPAAALAVEMFCYRARKYVGAYLAALEGAAEALVFTGGIGERSPEIRQRICAGLAWAGIALDAGSNARGEERIGASDSRLGVYALRSNEEALIAREALALVGRSRSQARVA